MPIRKIRENPLNPLLGAFTQRVTILADRAVAEGGSVRFRLDKAGVCPLAILHVDLTVDITNAGAGPTGTVRPFNPSQFITAINVQGHGDEGKRYVNVTGEMAYILACILQGGQAPWFDALTQAEARAITTVAVGIDIPLFFAARDFAPYACGAIPMERSDDVTVDVDFGTIADLVDNRGAGFAGTVVGTARLIQHIARVDADPLGFGAIRHGITTHNAALGVGEFHHAMRPFKVHRYMLALAKTTYTTVPTLTDLLITHFEIEQGGRAVLIDLCAADVRNAMLDNFGLPPAGPRADSPWTGVYMIDAGKKYARAPSGLAAAWNGEGKAQTTAKLTLAAGVAPQVEVLEGTLEGLYL